MGETHQLASHTNGWHYWLTRLGKNCFFHLIENSYWTCEGIQIDEPDEDQLFETIDYGDQEADSYNEWKRGDMSEGHASWHRRFQISHPKYRDPATGKLYIDHGNRTYDA